MLISDLYQNIINPQQAYEMAQYSALAQDTSEESLTEYKKRVDRMDLNAAICDYASRGFTELLWLVYYTDTIEMVIAEGYTIVSQGVIGEIAEKNGRKDWGAKDSDFYIISWEPVKPIEILK